MSTSPPLDCQLPRVNKFVGEVFGEFSNSRTIYAGNEEDTVKRDTRVILLIGPSAAAKSSLIDFFCNYFYGAELDQITRYHIADEKFDKTTPDKEIITYIFNDSVMDVRPVPLCFSCEEHCENLSQWLKENENLEVDVIGVVFSVFHRITSAEEEGLQKSLELFPPHLRQKCVVFMVGSDGSSPAVGVLRRFNLERADVYKVNTSCIFQRPEGFISLEHLRGNYWRMSLANFSALFSRLKYDRPVTYSSGQRHTASSAILTNSGTSPASTVRETTINDPYYDVFGARKETLTSTRHSWHEILKIPVETLIDFRSPVEHSKKFEYYGSLRNDRHVSGSRSRSVEPQFVAHPAQAGQTVSTGNILPDISERFERKTYNGAVDMRKSAVLSFGGRENSHFRESPSYFFSCSCFSFSIPHHRPRHISFLKWTPANCSNPRDCCLNCLFFFIAPLVVLFIVLAIIITLIVG
ncbi:unnamed protein product [Angiostrongylus costaricensis]|uniref:RNA polymerase II-associated factor 1 homolog n=1 Tax=Angiostrongylus costaricensis TaxID=334426 RepID=A0A0R3Q0N5_ANGCS|nr:unnamed protein product [Angiostrongylus costaricensis]